MWKPPAGAELVVAPTKAIFDEDGLPIGSLSAAYLTSRFSEQAADELARMVKGAGAEATERYRELRGR